MAVCLTVMMGRLGGMVGVNMVALLIETHCQLTFGIAATIMLMCGLLTFGIPHIMDTEKKETTAAASIVPDARRISIATVEGALKRKASYPSLTQ